MAENEVKLTKLAKCAGCGAKVGAGVLAQLLEGIQIRQDPNLLVGFDKTIPISLDRVPPPTRSPTSMPWAENPSCA